VLVAQSRSTDDVIYCETKLNFRF